MIVAVTIGLTRLDPTEADRHIAETAQVSATASSIAPAIPSSNPDNHDETLSAAVEAACSVDDSLPTDADLENGWFKWLADASKPLSQSSTGEHLHLAALLSQDPDERIRLINRALASTPSDAFVAWSAVRLCTEHQATECPLDAWQRRLATLDGQNSLAWAQIAMNAYQFGRLAVAIDALRRGASSADASDRWVDTIQLSERGLAAATNLHFSQRANVAFSIASTQIPAYGHLVSMCRAAPTESLDLAYACLALGEQIEEHADTEIAIMIGLAVQLQVLEALGEQEQASKVEARRNARRKAMSEFGVLDNQLRVITASPTVFEAYLERIRASDEVAAAKGFAEDLRILLEQRPDLACQPEN